MTKSEFDQNIFTIQFEECAFLHGHSKCVKLYNDNKFWSSDIYIKHGREFKNQLISHVYKKRGFKLEDLQYKTIKDI